MAPPVSTVVKTPTMSHAFTPANRLRNPSQMNRLGTPAVNKSGTGSLLDTIGTEFASLVLLGAHKFFLDQHVTQKEALLHSCRDLRSRVEKIRNLPTLPKVGMKILELASDPDVSMSELSQAIHQDPSLAARVLRIANSPFYGMVRQVDSLKLALVILGLNEVRNIALGISLFNVVKGMNTHVTYDREKFWYHSAGCGIAARILARKLEFRNEGTDFVSGLLHDIGKIIIDEYFCPEFVLIFNKTVTHKTTMLQAEREFLGASHQEVGSWLAEKWRIPETLCDAILYHHDLPENERPAIKDPKLAALCHLAEAFCETHEVGWDGDAGHNDLRDRQAWDSLLSGQDNYATADIDGILEEIIAEYSDARSSILWL